MLSRIAAACRTFLRWWISELAGLVPAPLRRTLLDDGRLLVVEIRGDEVVVAGESAAGVREVGRVDAAAADGARLGKAVAKLARRAGKGRVALRLPAERVLQKTVGLPLAAEENLRQVLAFEMDRHTPFTASEVYYDYRLRSRDHAAQRLSVDLVVAPREVVDDAVARAAGWGVAPDVVDCAGEARPPGGTINLLPPERGPADGARTWLSAALAVVALALLAAAVAIPIEQAKRTAEARWALVAEAKARAEAAERLRREIAERRERERFLIERKRASPAVIEVVAALTRLLPDDTWLLHLQLRDSQLSLTGYSTSASRLIGTIEASALFRHAKFRSIVARDRDDGGERFDLVAELAPPGGE